MRADLWEVLQGPEWAASVADADPGDGRFYDNVAALQDAIAISPFEYTRPLSAGMELDRYGTTRDTARGYRIVVFVRLDVEAHTCTLAWLALELL